jgi:hypothetical protein
MIQYQRSRQEVLGSVLTIATTVKNTDKSPEDGKNSDGSVGIALGYGLDDRSSRIRFPAGLGIFLFTTASRTALGPTPASYPMGTRDSFSGG